MSELQVDIQRCYACAPLPDLVVLTLAKCDAEIERLTLQWEVAEVGKVYAENERLRAALDQAFALLKQLLPCPRPWETEGDEAKLRIFTNLAREALCGEKP